jgi:hypothetical protein
MTVDIPLDTLDFKGFDLVGRHNRDRLATHTLEEGIEKYGTPTVVCIGDPTLIDPLDEHVKRRHATDDGPEFMVRHRREVGVNGIWLGYPRRDSIAR